MNFVGVPYFAPEILRRVRLDDAMKAKKLRQALAELAEEGVVQLFRPQDGARRWSAWSARLQLDVLQARLAAEYGVAIGFETSPYALARWVSSDDRAALQKFIAENRSGDGRRRRWRSGVPRDLGLHDAARGGTGAGRWRSATSRMCGRKKWRPDRSGRHFRHIRPTSIRTMTISRTRPRPPLG